MLLNSSGELSLPGKEKQPPLGVHAHHEQEAGDEQEQGEEEGGEQEGGRQWGRGAGLLLQQQDRVTFCSDRTERSAALSDSIGSVWYVDKRDCIYDFKSWIKKLKEFNIIVI